MAFERPKVFCIGGHKTGTSSMAQALSTLGYRMFPEQLWYGDSSLRAEYYAGEFDRLSALVAQYDAFEDSPFNHSDFYVWLFHACPDAKFILAVRDTANVVESYRRFLTKIEGPVLEQDPELHAYIRFFFRHEYGQTNPLDDEAQLARLYETRNQRVMDFFHDKPGRLLTLDLERESLPWQRICSFLGEPIPA